MVQKADRARIKALLTEAITVLCKNGLGYKYSCAVEGLLGITLDDEEVFLVNINENIAGATKRPSPEPEVAKAGTDSPAGGSPSTTPRRRRRRSNSGNMDRASPAKRANYGGGDEQQAGRQQEGSDVIVIKEEVSQEEFSDFYGDTGDGQDDSTNQYAMQQHQAQADQYGAGCSQWDTSQTQSGQSDWPAFTPTQQQQHAISQAASSAMLSPSQIVSGSRPSGNLKSPEVRAALRQHIVMPLLQPKYTITALRLSWFNQSVDYLNKVTEQLVPLRAQLDDYMKELAGVQMFISAVTATRSGAKKDTDMLIYPGVAYWVVMDSASFNQRYLCSYLQDNAAFSKPTLKLLLQPYQQTEKELTGALSAVLKDSMEGVVRRLVDYSAQMNLAQEAGTYPIVRISCKSNEPQKIVQKASAILQRVGLYVEMI